MEIESTIKKIQESIDLMQSRMSDDKELNYLLMQSINKNQDRLAIKESLLDKTIKESSFETLGIRRNFLFFQLNIFY
jgi:hypothetical protein